MAGEHHSVHFDPAIDRWAAMRENVYQHFKFTPKATRQVALFGVLIPASIALASVCYDAKFDWAGKTKEESLRATPPAAAAAEE